MIRECAQIGGDYLCSREEGHEGPHVALTDHATFCAAWVSDDQLAAAWAEGAAHVSRQFAEQGSDDVRTFHRIVQAIPAANPYRSDS